MNIIAIANETNCKTTIWQRIEDKKELEDQQKYFIYEFRVDGEEAVFKTATF